MCILDLNIYHKERKVWKENWGKGGRRSCQTMWMICKLSLLCPQTTPTCRVLCHLNFSRYHTPFFPPSFFYQTGIYVVLTNTNPWQPTNFFFSLKKWNFKNAMKFQLWFEVGMWMSLSLSNKQLFFFFFFMSINNQRANDIWE